jgi:hypothetical protein
MNKFTDNQEQQLPSEAQRMLQVFSDFVETATSAEDLTFLGTFRHDDRDKIDEDEDVRLFLEEAGLFSIGMPSYFEIKHLTAWEDDGSLVVRGDGSAVVHDRIIATGTTPTGVEYRVVSTLVFDEAGASEILFLAPHELLAENEEIMLKLNQEWLRQIAAEAGDVVDEDAAEGVKVIKLYEGEAEFSVDPRMKTAHEVGRAITFLDTVFDSNTD